MKKLKEKKLIFKKIFVIFQSKNFVNKKNKQKPKENQSQTIKIYSI